MFKEIMTPIISSLNATVKNGLLSPGVSGKTAWQNWMMLAGLSKSRAMSHRQLRMSLGRR